MSPRCFRETIRENDPRVAVRRIVEGAGTCAPALTCVFVDSRYDLDALAAELRKQLHGPILACTTAGHQTAESGLVDTGLVAMALVTDQLRAAIEPIHHVSRFGTADARAAMSHLAMDCAPPDGPGSRFQVLLIDGMSGVEERVSALLYGASNGVPMVGASAGDGQRFEKTYVFDGEYFVSDAAVVARIDTTLPHRTFGHQYFMPLERRMVVTRAAVEKRQILELDGESASAVYREAIGQKTLDGQTVAHHPLLLRWDGRDYARAIRAWDEDRLDMFCAVEEGMVVRVGELGNLVSAAEGQLKELQASLGGDMLALVAFTCFQRRLDNERAGEQDRYRTIMAPYPLIGFCTYGEQFNGVHVNQMATGFALGNPAQAKYVP